MKRLIMAVVVVVSLFAFSTAWADDFFGGEYHVVATYGTDFGVLVESVDLVMNEALAYVSDDNGNATPLYIFGQKPVCYLYLVVDTRDFFGFPCYGEWEPIYLGKL